MASVPKVHCEHPPVPVVARGVDSRVTKVSDHRIEIPDRLDKKLSKLPRILLRPEEAATSLGLSPRTLLDLTKHGKVPCLKLGKLVRYSPHRLRRWAMQQSTGGEGNG